MIEAGVGEVVPADAGGVLDAGAALSGPAWEVSEGLSDFAEHA